MLHPTSLKIAVAVAETGSVTDAARRVHLSQPAVSYHLRKLERMAGGPVFARGAAGMIPTPAGETLLAGARRILAEMRATRDEVQRIAAGEGRPLRLSSACFTNYHWLPDVLNELGGPPVELDVDPGRRPFEKLDRGELDLALTSAPPERGAFRSEPLFQDEIVAVMAPCHPLAGRPFLNPGDFGDQPVAVFDRRRSDLFTRILEPAGIRPRRVTDVPVTEALLEMVRSGTVISAMARWIPEPDLQDGRLVAVQILEEGLHLMWHAVFSDRRAPHALAEGLVKVLRGTREGGGNR